MNVSAIIVTRGNVDIQPVIDSLPQEWEILIWFNSDGIVEKCPANWDDRTPMETFEGIPDLSVYGRYAAITYASHELIYVQDDDVIVSDPQAIVDEWEAAVPYWEDDFLVANMPQEFRHDGYTDSCLVGFGACFYRELPDRVFHRFLDADVLPGKEREEWFNRTCDVVFTTLVPRVLVDVPKEDREFASAPDRMWKQPGHHGERVKMLELARMVRDG